MEIKFFLKNYLIFQRLNKSYFLLDFHLAR